MAYIGKTPTVGNFQKCDAISVVNGQAAYTLQVGGSNVSPESPNHVLVSLNGILQAPTDSYTISGSTLTFASNLATGDVIDFVMLLGNVLDLGTPSDNTVTAAKLNNDIISGQTELASEPADTDEFLVSDAGTIKRIDYSLIKGGGVTHIDQWYLTSNQNKSGSGAETLTGFTQNTEKFATLGSSMSESSGIWTFPTTGYWMIAPTFYLQNSNGTALAYLGGLLHTTNNNSTYTAVLQTYSSAYTNGAYASPNFVYVMDVTDTSNDKCKILAEGQGSWIAEGGNHVKTGVKFIRLGDT